MQRLFIQLTWCGILAIASTVTLAGVGAAETPANPATTITASAEPQAAKPSTASATVDTDLWQRVRRGFVMDELVSPLVQNQELWYANRPDYINRFVERGARYMHHIVEEVEKRGLPTEIVLLPIIDQRRSRLPDKTVRHV